VTDADVVLGRIDPGRFSGGKISLDPVRAHDAVLADVGARLDMHAEEAARGIVEIVDETMASAARVHAVENGKDTVGRTMIAFGGAAPLHAARLAQKLGIARVVIPVDAGVGSAHGFLDAPIAYEVARTFLIQLGGLNPDLIEDLYCDMRAEAEAVVRLGFPSGVLSEGRTAFMRYRGQGHEIAVPLDRTALDPLALRAAFEATYTQLFGRIIPGLEIEVVTWTLALSQPYALPAADPRVAGTRRAVAQGTRTMVESVTGAVIDAPVYTRALLEPGAELFGPAAIVEDGTTTIIPTGFTARIAHRGEIIIEGGLA
jgi:N-methylhydantoinase A